MFEVFFYFVCILCITGISLMLAGGRMMIWADCEVLEIVNVTSIIPIKDGIGMCDAEFIYHNPSMHGMLTITCPRNMAGNVAVCYSLFHPERYKASVLASGLDVKPHSTALNLLNYGFGLAIIPMLVMSIIQSMKRIDNIKIPVKYIECTTHKASGDVII
jgi:hypothetical protein